MRAIISVSNKHGVTDFVRGLIELGWEIFSTGGTKKALAEIGLPVRSISDLTGFPEILDGRVKTLHPTVHGGLLARRDLPSHMAELEKNGITPIDMVVVNLYPFVQTVSRAGVDLPTALENIDIGGPTMIRAAAKNFPSVLVVVDPADYEMVLSKLAAGTLELVERQSLAQKAFQHVAAYDTAISQYLRQGAEGFPEEITFAFTKRYDLRYGENPHQKAAFYAEQSIVPQNQGITWAKQLWGKELSFNNILDASAAWATASDFPEPTVVIVKHTNPCGLASHPDLDEAYRRAFSGDPVSAFGGIVACNRPITLKMAEEMAPTFYEIVVAPGYDADALDKLKEKKNLRILLAENPADGTILPREYTDYRRVPGGLLVQEGDALDEDSLALRAVTQRTPTSEEMEDLKFAWRVVKHIKSNAIVMVKDKTLLGMGAGQPNRVVSVALSKEKAGPRAQGSVLASDAMFPFPDSVEQAAAAGVTAIIQPGGSIRDEESVKAADKNNIAMVLTGIRHFLH
ncbi:MAG: bifunctional phosphoribosylaminoimidazolecarboxamide formyltransferase/IMP cyclohydrolase [Dehalococcoidia bacterium]|nr:bifunctional phosphoribosylaminoimidazolecarboxamide formyltransferase/IMP cyclohydrolase [Dehalococcoidia bacterium]